MSRIQKAIWVVGITVTILVNAAGAMRPVYKGVQAPVASNLVSVYTCRGEPWEMPTPVMEENDTAGKFIETGQKVQVYLRNGYKDNIIVSYPRRTLSILTAAILLHFGAGALLRNRESQNTPVPKAAESTQSQ